MHMQSLLRFPMQLDCSCLVGCAQAGKHVDVVACGGSEPLAEILEHRSITLHTLPEPCASVISNQAPVLVSHSRAHHPLPGVTHN
jgi:hypothetical protein